MFDNCKHTWKVITESYEESPINKILKLGMSLKDVSGNDFFFGTKLVILQCEKCGKLDKTLQKM